MDERIEDASAKTVRYALMVLMAVVRCARAISLRFLAVLVPTVAQTGEAYKSLLLATDPRSFCLGRAAYVRHQPSDGFGRFGGLPGRGCDVRCEGLPGVELHAEISYGRLDRDDVSLDLQHRIGVYIFPGQDDSLRFLRRYGEAVVSHPVIDGFQRWI